MNIDDRLIQYLEDLSCLTLSEGEKNRITDDLQKILHFFDFLSELNTDGVPECSHPFDNVNVFREDAVRPSLDRALLLRNAAVHNDEYFIAPKTVE